MKNKQGFTLIELSIVIVIIGLLVGGALVGKDLIEGAQKRQAISDFDRLTTQVVTFKLKYNCLPGDCKNATNFFSGATNGNGNKMYDTAVTNVEGALQSFYQLQEAGLSFYGPYTGTYGSGMTPGVNAPKLPWAEKHVQNYSTAGGVLSGSKVGLQLVHRAFCAVNQNNGCEPSQVTHTEGALLGSGNRIVINGIRTSNSSYFLAGLDSHYLRDLDRKMDDGKPLTGRLKVTTFVAGGPDWKCGNGTDFDLNQDYNTATNRTCAAAVDLGI